MTFFFFVLGQLSSCISWRANQIESLRPSSLYSVDKLNCWERHVALQEWKIQCVSPERNWDVMILSYFQCANFCTPDFPFTFDNPKLWLIALLKCILKLVSTSQLELPKPQKHTAEGFVRITTRGSLLLLSRENVSRYNEILFLLDFLHCNKRIPPPSERCQIVKRNMF